MIRTTGDSAELCLNDQLIGRRAQGDYEYGLRFDEAVYEPGTLRVVAFKDGEAWASATRVQRARPGYRPRHR